MLTGASMEDQDLMRPVAYQCGSGAWFGFVLAAFKDFCYLTSWRRAKSLAPRGPNPACLCLLLHPELIGHTLARLVCILFHRDVVVKFELFFDFLAYILCIIEF